MKKEFYVLKGPTQEGKPLYLCPHHSLTKYYALYADIRRARFFDSESEAVDFIELYANDFPPQYVRTVMDEAINLNALAIHKVTMEVEE